MELFLLIRNRAELPEELPGNILDDFFDSDSLSRKDGQYRFYLNRKTLAPSCIQFSNISGSAYATGTFVYRGGGPAESLRSILDDFSNGCFDAASLIGHYFIFLFLPSGIKILHDGTGLVKAYHDSRGSFLASSFLLAARLAGINRGALSLNRDAATENLLTGGITGTDTLVNEITSFSRNSISGFPGIEFIIPEPSIRSEVPASEAEAVSRESGILDDYFRACSRLADISGVDSGLTGGYDSRLILACAIKHFENLQVHSHFRPGGSVEWRIAREIAAGERLTFVSPQVISPERMDDDMLLQIISSSFRFNDGIISLHCNWMEEYNTLEYRQKVLGDKRLGLSGVGGEQYRNHDRLFCKPWLFSQWLKYLHVRKVSGNAFINPGEEQKLLEMISAKICNILGFSPGKRWIDLRDLKRIQNEVLIPAYRGARTDAENRHSWYLSPFADRVVSSSAYGIVPFLKDSKKFEAGLIKAISPSLAAYPTDHGYDLISGEPLYLRKSESAFENLLPASIKWKARNLMRTGDTVSSDARLSKLLHRYLENVISLGLPVSVPALFRRAGTAHMVVSLGFVLEKLNIATAR